MIAEVAQQFSYPLLPKPFHLNECAFRHKSLL